MPNFLEIKKLIEHQIHGEEVFGKNYTPPEGASFDNHGWFGEVHVYDEIIDSIKPNIIIEVGTWKGTSALHMTERMKSHKPDCFTICVDTWLGSYEHRSEPHWRDELKLKNGRPQLYETFLYNVYSKGLADHILPIPLPSDQAARILKPLKIKVPFIYIDAGHDELNVSLDITNYWDLLMPGGVMLGDDYNPEMWPGLTKAVHNFEKVREAEIDGPVKIYDGKWIMVKR